MPLAKCGSLIDSNAYPPCLRGLDCILVYSGCIEQQGVFHVLATAPQLDGCAGFSACPEAVHINMLGFKLAGMIARAQPRRVVVVTVDGSMHCIQLHYMVEEIERIIGGFAREHYVIERGELVRVPDEVVRMSRFLARLTRIYTRGQGNTRARVPGERRSE